MVDMIELNAEIVLRAVPEIGIRDYAYSGIRPSFNYQGELVACEVFGCDGMELLPVGRSVDVMIRLPYADELGWDLKPGIKFCLNVASIIIADGIVAGQHCKET